MAHGIKYRISYYRMRSGGLTTIDILQRGYGGGITTILGGASPFESSFEGDTSNIYTPTNGSGATLNFVNQTPLALLELYTNDPQEWMVQVWDGITDTDSDASSDAGGHLRWQGFISPEIFNEQYSNPIASLFTVQCNDGMQVLDIIEYKNGTDLYAGQQTIGQIILNVLSKLEIEFRTIYMSNDLEVIALETNLLAHLDLFNENFIDESEVPMSCRQVLDSIIGGLGLTMWFEGYNIYIVDPINLHDTTKGRSYDIHTFAETVTSVGGYLDISAGEISWGKVGTSLDIVPAVSNLLVKYNPYNVTEKTYIFSDSLNWDTEGTFEDDYNYQLNDDIEYTGWVVDSATIPQIAMRKTAYTVPEFVMRFANDGGEISYEFSSIQVLEDTSIVLRISMDVYVQTKRDDANIFDSGSLHDVNRIKIPIAVKIGDYYYQSGTSWDDDSAGVGKWQEWWLVGTELEGNYLQETFNDSWTSCKYDVSLRPPTEGHLLSGVVTVEFLDEFTSTFDDPVIPFNEPYYYDTLLNESSMLTHPEIGFTYLTSTSFRVTITGFKDYMGLDARENLFDDAITLIASDVVGNVVAGNYHTAAHADIPYASTIANTTFTIVSYTSSTDVLVFDVATTSGVYFDVDYDHIDTMILTEIDYTYDYQAVLLFIKNIKASIVDGNTRLPITNEVIESKAKLSTNLNGKQTFEINVTSGTGPLGVSRGAFKSDLMAIPRDNITGLYRGIDGDSSDTTETYNTNAELLLQSFMSQYKQPRFLLNGRLNVVNQPWNIRSKLIKDSNHMTGMAFYIVNGTYYDKEEMMDVTLLEIEDTRETIL